MTDLTPNIPEVVAEVTALFERYEQALIDKNVEVLDATFWNSPHTIRLANAEHGYGFDRIHAHREARPPGPGTKEKRLRLDVADARARHRHRDAGLQGARPRHDRAADADLGALSRCRLEGDRGPRLDDRGAACFVKRVGGNHGGRNDAHARQCDRAQSRLGGQDHRAGAGARPADRRPAPSSLAARGQRLHVPRPAGRHPDRPQHRRHRVRRLPFDVPQGRPGRDALHRRDRVRQRRGGDERLGHLRQPARLPGHRQPRRPAPRRQGGRGVRRPDRRRQRPLQGHPLPDRLGRRSRHPQLAHRSDTGADARQDLARGLQGAGQARPHLRCLALPSADRRDRRAGRCLPEHPDHPRPCRRAAGLCRLCRPARRGARRPGRRRWPSSPNARTSP